MRRYWIQKDSFNSELFNIEGEDFHHIVNVCRMTLGSKFEVLIGDGNAYFVEIIELQKKSATVKCLESRTVAPIKKPYIHLVLSIPKFSTLENILEKSVEMGVKEITPVASDYSFVRKLPGPLEKKYPRWQKIIQSATQQCGRAEKLCLNKAQTLDQILEVFNQKANAAGLFAYEGDADQNLQAALEPLRASSLDEVYLFVGSEGGFSFEEVNKFSSHQLKSVSLGDQVLRVETACIALISILKYDLVGLG